MRCAVWFYHLGLPNVQFELPYESQSPVLRERVKYETKQDILDEVFRIIKEANERGYDTGQSLYHQIPFFADPMFIISGWCWNMISDYYTIKKYNIPLASSLDDIDAWTLDSFNVIDEEINNVMKFSEKKNGS